jgi:hypothetical protein
VLTRKVIEIGRTRNPVTIDDSRLLEFVRSLPDLPVFCETLLLTELAAGARPIELARISKLMLTDPGATIQVMRLAGRQCGAGGDSDRIEDCISGLGVNACLDAMSRWTITRTGRYAAIEDAWEHARTIAEISSQLAKERVTDASPEDAALVGLCHEIGRWPEVLGWHWAAAPAGNDDLAGLTIAEAWSLPWCVREYFASRSKTGVHSQWPAIIERAHQIAESQAGRCRRHHLHSPGPESAEKLQAI